MRGTILFVCSTSWVSRCPVAAISAVFFLIRSKIRAKARPVNLVLRSPWSARENLPQDLGCLVNPVNVDEGQGDHTSTSRFVRTTQNPEVERSQVRRQENAQNSDSWKQGDQEESSNSTSTRRLVRAATPRTEFQNMKYTNHQYMAKILHFLQKKLGMTSECSTFSMEAFNRNVLVWRMFMSSSMKAAIHLGPNYLANLEVYKNTNFNEIQSLFNITHKLTLEHSEEILNVNTIESPTSSWTKTVFSHDPVDTSKSTCLLRFRSMLGKDEWKHRCNYEMGRSSGRIQNVSFLQRIAGNRWRSNWIRVEYFTRIFVIADSWRDPDCFAKAEHRTWEIYRQDHLHVNVQRHRLEKRKRWNLYFEVSKSQGIREEILAGTLDVSWSWRRKEVVRNSSFTLEGKWDSTATEMVERFKDTGHPVFKSISALSRGILKKKSNRDTIHFNADASTTELLFRIIHSVNQLSIYGAVSNWCEQFGLTEEEKGQEKQKESLTKGVLTSVK